MLGGLLGYEDVALLDNMIKGKREMPYLSKSTAESVRKKAWKGLVEEYIKMEGVHKLDAEIEVDALISCCLIDQNSEEQTAELN